jgi:hypothetical protein
MASPATVVLGLDDDTGQPVLLELTEEVRRRWEDRIRINSLEPLSGSGMHSNFVYSVASPLSYGLYVQSADPFLKDPDLWTNPGGAVVIYLWHFNGLIANLPDTGG